MSSPGIRSEPPMSFHEASGLHQSLQQLLDLADIRINGDQPWDMQLKATDVPERIFSQRNLGLGESYMEGAWSAPQLDEFFYRLLRAGIDQRVKPVRMLYYTLRATLLNLQGMKRAKQVAEKHYDLGNDFYEAMLDPRMTYTCGFWQHAGSLAEAQEHKLELICRKLQLRPGMRVLDVGCGWGSFVSYAAQHYGVECVGITISTEQLKWAQQRYAHLPVEIRLQDYRELDEKFDRIASIGMFEHVGRKNYRAYMDSMRRCLRSDGLFLLHTIGRNTSRGGPDPWIDKYIFPNGDLPSAGQIGDAVDGRFVVEDLHNFGADYDKTLMAWHSNFVQAWPRFEDQLGIRFFRMWQYYLLSCAGAFRARKLQLWQWVLSPQGVEGGYSRVSDAVRFH